MLFANLSNLLSIIVNGFGEFFGILSKTVGEWLTSALTSTDNEVLETVIDWLLGTSLANLSVFELFFSSFAIFIAIHFIYYVLPLN